MLGVMIKAYEYKLKNDSKTAPAKNTTLSHQFCDKTLPAL